MEEQKGSKDKYTIELSVNAQLFLRKLDKVTKDRIEIKLKTLSTIPIPSNSKFIGRMKGEKIFRLRICIYRILYTVKVKERIILVAKIDKRSKIYL